MNKAKLHNVIYNGETGQFEGRVDIQRDGQTFRYPCQLAAPQSMDMATVTRHLTQQAERMSDTTASAQTRH